MVIQGVSFVVEGSTSYPGSLAARCLGIRTADVIKVARRLQGGLPYDALKRLQRRSGLSLEAIGTVMQIPRRTLARRRNQGKLTPRESERLYRLAVVFEKCVELFEGDIDAARSWLDAPNKALAGHSPLAMAEMEIGAREVEDLIGRLEHGVFT